MKTIRLVAILSLALPTMTLAADPAPKTQGPPPPPPLLSADGLQKRLSDPKLRLLDARPKADYAKGHIPGAVWLDLAALGALTKPETIADKDAWARGLAPLGITAESEVFLYDADHQHQAGRAWWLLSYAGVPNVGLIDGGFPFWEREKRPVSSETPTVAAHDVAIAFHAGRLASRDDVQSAVKGAEVQLVDARSAEEYRGEKKPQNGSRAGHIPGARSLDLYSLFDADGKYLEPSAVRDRLKQAGIVAERPIIVYANGGGRSGGVIFALRRSGIRARHYALGLNDWSSDKARPVIEGAETSPRAE